MKPYAHQERFVLNAPPKWGVWHSTGTGKTYTALFTLVRKGISTALVICPKGVKTKWLKTIEKDFYFITIVVMTKEEFRKCHLDLKAYEAVIIDEAHHFSGIKSQMHKALLKYITKNKIKYVYPMTATPYRREAWNIYALAKILGHKWDYINFRHVFYREQRFGHRVVWVPKTGMQNEIAKLVHAIGDVVSYSECGDMPPVQHKVEYVEQTKVQEMAMEELKLYEANPLTFYLREHQIMSGVGVDSNKVERILDICEPEDKVAIFCRYTAQITELKKILTEAGYHVVIIDGNTKDKNKAAESVERLERCVVLIQMDSAEGFELPSVDVAVFASMSYSYLAYVQSMGRFIRINKQNKPKLFIYLLTKSTIDEDVYQNIMKKQDFDLQIYAKERGKVSGRV